MNECKASKKQSQNNTRLEALRSTQRGEGSQETNQSTIVNEDYKHSDLLSMCVFSGVLSPKTSFSNPKTAEDTLCSAALSHDHLDGLEPRPDGKYRTLEPCSQRWSSGQSSAYPDGPFCFIPFPLKLKPRTTLFLKDVEYSSLSFYPSNEK